MAETIETMREMAKLEQAVALITQQMGMLTVSLARIEATVDKQAADQKLAAQHQADKRPPWTQIAALILSVLGLSGSLFWHFETANATLAERFDKAVVDLRLTDRDSINERQQMRANIGALAQRQCPIPQMSHGDDK